MSADLIAFLKAWHEWATSGAPNHKPFLRVWGLCSNCDQFCPEVSRELAVLIDKQFPGESYPFGEDDYMMRGNEKCQHECPKRLAWVRAKLAEAGELVA